MAVQYRKLTENDLETFIEMRIRQLREEGATEEIDLEPALFDYYRRHMSDGTFVSWLAVDGEKLWRQAACPLWKSRRISVVPMEGSGSFPVCILPMNTADRALQRLY